MSDPTSTRGRRSIWEVRIEREFWDGGAASIGPAAGYVYLALRAFEVRSTKTAKIRVRKLAEVLGMGASTVRRALSTLVESGWIRPVRSPGSSSLYLLGEGSTYFTDAEPRSNRAHPEVGTALESGAPRTPNRARIERTTPLESSAPPLESSAPSSNTSSFNTSKKKTSTRERAIRRVRKPLREMIEQRGDPKPDPTPQPPSATTTTTSAKVKAIDGRPLTGEELVELWCERFRSRFDVEDLSLRTKAARKRAGSQLLRRTVDWLEGDQDKLRVYLGETLRWWKVRQQRGERFPGGLPSLAKLLEKKPSGEVSWFFDHWRSRRMAAEIREPGGK